MHLQLLGVKMLPNFRGLDQQSVWSIEVALETGASARQYTPRIRRL